MSETTHLSAFSHGITPYIPSDEILLAVLAIFPILAYPFLPSVGRSRVPCEAFLVWSSGIGLALVPLTREVLEPHIEHNDLSTRPPSYLWMMNLLVGSFMVGFERLWKPNARRPRTLVNPVGDKQFETVLNMTAVHVLFHLSNSLGNSYLLAEADGLVWLIILLMDVISGFLLWSAIAVLLKIGGPTVLYNFTTRRVDGWSWLPENGAPDDFGPGWSFALAIFVAITPIFVLLAVVVKVRDN